MHEASIDYLSIKRRAVANRFVSLVREIRYLELVGEFQRPLRDPDLDRRLAYATGQLARLVSANTWLVDEDAAVPS